MRRHLLLLALLLGCTGGQTGVPASEHRTEDAGDPRACASTRASATALGLTSADLLALYGGTHDFTLNRRRQLDDWSPGPAEVQVRIEASDDQRDRRVLDCAEVAVPVKVTLGGPDLGATGTGVLRGSLQSAYLDFSVRNGSESASGWMGFAGGQIELSFQLGGLAWTTEVP